MKLAIKSGVTLRNQKEQLNNKRSLTNEYNEM